MELSAVFQLVTAIIVGAVGWNIRIMLNQFSTSMKDIREDFSFMNKLVITHVADHEIHSKGKVNG